MVKNATVVIGGAEHDDGRVFFYAHAVPCWPVEDVAGCATFAGTVGVGHERFSALDIPPLHRLADVLGKPFEQRGDVSACGKCQVHHPNRPACLKSTGARNACPSELS